MGQKQYLKEVLEEFFNKKLNSSIIKIRYLAYFFYGFVSDICTLNLMKIV